MMIRTKIAVIPLWLALASVAAAQETPPSAALASAVCPRYGIDAAACGTDAFEAPVAIDLEADGVDEWIWVPRRGAPSECFVRSACFAIAARHGGGWRVVLEGRASWIGFDGERREGGRRALVTGGANGADEYEVQRFVWAPRQRAYRPAGRATCRHDAAPQSPLCRAIDASIPLQ
jgi:hypothetical protein